MKPKAKAKPAPKPSGPVRARTQRAPDDAASDEEHAALRELRAKYPMPAPKAAGGPPSTAGLMDFIHRLDKALKTGADKWDVPISQVKPYRSCRRCNERCELLLASSVALSTANDALSPIYDDCWFCEPLTCIRKRANNTGAYYRVYYQDEMEAADQFPLHQRFYSTSYEVSIPFMRHYPNGAIHTLATLEYSESAGLLVMGSYLKDRQATMLIIGKKAQGDSLAQWLQREHPTWIVDLDGLLKEPCKTWPRA